MDETRDDDGTARTDEAGRGPYRIELAGRAGDRVLRPLEDDFAIERRRDRTILRGRVRDAAHLHGVVTRLTAMGVTIVSFGPESSSSAPGEAPTPGR